MQEREGGSLNSLAEHSFVDPTLEVRKYPQCCEAVDIFSHDVKGRSNRNGFERYNGIQSWVQWCRHAREFLRDELFQNLSWKRTFPDKQSMINLIQLLDLR